jgi:hypothetical protein
MAGSAALKERLGARHERAAGRQLRISPLSSFLGRVFRHTWTAARLQTLDHGAPVSIYTVSRELGHGSRRWYGVSTRTLGPFGTVRRSLNSGLSNTSRHSKIGSESSDLLPGALPGRG